MRFAIAMVMVGLTAYAQNSVDWKALEPQIGKMLSSQAMNFHHDGPPQVFRTATLKSSRLPVALIDLGGEGASTDAIEVVYVDAGHPVLGEMRMKDGEVSDSGDLLLQGASVMHSDRVDIDAANDAIVHSHMMMAQDGEKIQECGVEAYRWNAKTKLFEWNGPLSSSLARPYCAHPAN